jgi:hypothetical protein
MSYESEIDELRDRVSALEAWAEALVTTLGRTIGQPFPRGDARGKTPFEEEHHMHGTWCDECGGRYYTKDG